MNNLLDRFRSVGHKTPQSLDAELPEETFPPIQRIVRKGLFRSRKTAGYLFRNVEYKKGCVDDVILSPNWLRNYGSEIHSTLREWQEYEQDEARNPLGWFIPSGPLVLELCYRSQQDTGPLANEIRHSWQKTFDILGPFLPTSTLVTRVHNNALITHDWVDEAQEIEIPKKEEIIITDTTDATINQTLYSLFGKRYKAVPKTFGQYGKSVVLSNELVPNEQHSLLLNFNIWFYISIYHCNNDRRAAHGVTLAKNILSDPRYEVWDE